MEISLPSFLFGVAAGMRSMTGAAALCWAGSLGRARPGWAPTSDRALKVALVLAAGEMAGDKMPFAPDRRAAPAFAARLAIGAAGGAALGETVERGALAGALGALTGTLVGRLFRGAHTRTTDDWVRALTEDAVAVAFAYSAVRSQRATVLDVHEA